MVRRQQLESEEQWQLQQQSAEVGCWLQVVVGQAMNDRRTYCDQHANFELYVAIR
jgi:hypothetical protein